MIVSEPTGDVGLVVLDRDGTLTVAPPEGEYILSAADLRLLPGAGEAVAALNAAGLRVAVATNQRCVALGLLTVEDLVEVHETLRQLLARHGAHLDSIHVCPHEIGDCDCRKPEPGLVLAAIRRAGVAPDRTVMIGDRSVDVEAARNAGARGVLLTGPRVDGGRSGADLAPADGYAENVAEAVRQMLADDTR